MQVSPLYVNAERLRTHILKLAEFVDSTQAGWTRRPFTSFYTAARSWFMSEMEACGLEVSIDAGSNVIGRLVGSDPTLPSIMIGSHLDTVTGGGRFDGIVGVMAGLEIAYRLQETGRKLKHTLEIVDFTAEEPSEFGVSTIGSRAMVNHLTEEMLELRDPSGRKLSEAIQRAGGSPGLIPSQARVKGQIALYLELHIEQGPILEQNNMKLGVVTGIVGIQRYRVILEGKPNHAGTTPMSYRQDALTGASELILLLETICSAFEGEALVGTVGKCNVEPNASNVIPGKVIFDLEVRSLEVHVMEQAITCFRQAAEKIAERRGLQLHIENLSKSAPIAVEPAHLQMIYESCSSIASTQWISSGAGHDANQLAAITSIAMIFVPSKEGRSHCPEEWTSNEDIALGVEALGRAMLLFDQQ